MNGRYNYGTRGIVFVTNSSCVCGHFFFFHRNEQLENSLRISVSIIPGFDQKLLAWHRETSLDLLAREACIDQHEVTVLLWYQWCYDAVSCEPQETSKGSSKQSSSRLMKPSKLRIIGKSHDDMLSWRRCWKKRSYQECFCRMTRTLSDVGI